MPIDSVDLLYGAIPLTPASRQVRHVADPRAGRISLDVDDLVQRHGSKNGELQWKLYPTGRKAFGHWNTGLFQCQYNEDAGWVRIRASLPKIFALIEDPENPDPDNGRQLTVIDAHAALRRLAQLGSEFFGVELNLREAVPTRLDIYYQWEVESVAAVLKWFEEATPPAAKFDLTANPRGGRTAYWDKARKGKPAVRAYDKGAELQGKGRTSPYGIDELLRIELQSRGIKHNLVYHEDGYRAASLQERYEAALAPLSTLFVDDVAAFLDYDEDADPQKLPGRLPVETLSRLGLVYLAKNPENWPMLKARKPASTYHHYRANARKAGLATRPWSPVLPDEAFGDPRASLWVDDHWAEVAA